MTAITTITRKMGSIAIEVLLERGYAFKYPASDPKLVWLQAPGPDHPSDTPWWPICQMNQTEVWNLIWSLYEQEVGQQTDG